MTPSDVTIAIAFAEFLFLLVATVGGYLVLRSSISKTSAEVQERVRMTLMDENTLLQSRIVRLEAENKRLNDAMALIIDTFEKRGVIVEVDGDMVIVRDASGTITVRQKKPPKQTP